MVTMRGHSLPEKPRSNRALTSAITSAWESFPERVSWPTNRTERLKDTIIPRVPHVFVIDRNDLVTSWPRHVRLSCLSTPRGDRQPGVPISTLSKTPAPSPGTISKITAHIWHTVNPFNTGYNTVRERNIFWHPPFSCAPSRADLANPD